MSCKKRKAIEEYLDKLPICEDDECKSYKISGCQVEYLVENLAKSTMAANEAIDLAKRIQEGWSKQNKKLKDVYDKYA